MKKMKKLLSLLLVSLLLLLPMSACAGGGDGNIDSDKKPTVLHPEETLPTIVATPTLGSVEEIVDFGVQSGDTIISCEKVRGDGVTYDGLNELGKRLWKASNGEKWNVGPKEAVPEGFPTLVVPKGTEITLHNRTEYEVLSDYYIAFSGEENYEPNALPNETGIYIRVVTIEIPRPSIYDEEPEIGTFYGEYLYIFVLSVE